MKGTKTSKICTLVVGNDYEFQYPRHNLTVIKPQTERRRVRVVEIKDFKQNPIEPAVKRKFPFVRRGRFLVTGLDLDKGVERSFYFESMSEIEQITYKPDPHDRYEIRLVSAGQPDRITEVGVSQIGARITADIINRSTRFTDCTAHVVPQCEAFLKSA